MPEATDKKMEEATFFLPDLCQAQTILFLVLISELLVFVLVLFTSEPFSLNLLELALVSLFVQWLVLSSAALLCNIRPWLTGLSVPRATTIAYGLILFLTFLYSLVAEHVLHGFVLPGTEGWGNILRNLVIATIMTGIAFRYFFIAHQLRLQEQAELNARIQALQSRIRPHFLFNSMNIIASLIAVNPELAEEVVEDLSTLFRASLDEATGHPVKLSQELDLCQKYVHIESLRLDDRLKVTWQIEVDIEEVRIPMLTIQPLLENAIYHGVQPRPEGGIVVVAISDQDDRIVIEITNPASPLGYQHESGNNMALENIRNRLSAVYGPRASLAAFESDGRFIARLYLPKIPI